MERVSDFGQEIKGKIRDVNRRSCRELDYEPTHPPLSDDSANIDRSDAVSERKSETKGIARRGLL